MGKVIVMVLDSLVVVMEEQNNLEVIVIKEINLEMMVKVSLVTLVILKQIMTKDIKTP